MDIYIQAPTPHQVRKESDVVSPRPATGISPSSTLVLHGYIHSLSVNKAHCIHQLTDDLVNQRLPVCFSGFGGKTNPRENKSLRCREGTQEPQPYDCPWGWRSQGQHSHSLLGLATPDSTTGGDPRTPVLNEGGDPRTPVFQMLPGLVSQGAGFWGRMAPQEACELGSHCASSQWPLCR